MDDFDNWILNAEVGLATQLTTQLSELDFAREPYHNQPRVRTKGKRLQTGHGNRLQVLNLNAVPEAETAVVCSCAGFRSLGQQASAVSAAEQTN